jgi:hypothetical protein
VAYDGDIKQFTVVDDEVAGVLRQSRELVANGWHRGWTRKLIGDKYHFCALGAMTEAWWSARDRVALSDVLSRFHAALPPGFGVAGFNDAPGRTKEEVLAVFDKAIGG